MTGAADGPRMFTTKSRVAKLPHVPSPKPPDVHALTAKRKRPSGSATTVEVEEEPRREPEKTVAPVRPSKMRRSYPAAPATGSHWKVTPATRIGGLTPVGAVIV